MCEFALYVCDFAHITQALSCILLDLLDAQLKASSSKPSSTVRGYEGH